MLPRTPRLQITHPRCTTTEYPPRSHRGTARASPPGFAAPIPAGFGGTVIEYRDWLIAELERVCATPRFVFARGVLRAPGLQQLPAAVALEVQLALLLVFTEATAVSLWRLRALDEELEHTAHAGEFNLRALYTRRVARRLLACKPSGSYVEGSAVGVAVEVTVKAGDKTLLPQQPQHRGPGGEARAARCDLGHRRGPTPR